MSAKKIYDLAVVKSNYTNSQGEEKGNWLNVGAVMQKDDGGKFLLLDRTFNPAGVPNPDNRSNLILSMFAPKNQDQPPEPESAPPPGDDDIPF